MAIFVLVVKVRFEEVAFLVKDLDWVVALELFGFGLVEDLDSFLE